MVEMLYNVIPIKFQKFGLAPPQSTLKILCHDSTKLLVRWVRWNTLNTPGFTSSNQ